ncbi:MAG: PadR family transcriptional regulator, partial [Mycobacterium sp.]|nr:PadR family transcriptional regulator [Mycobacterium sp.]
KDLRAALETTARHAREMYVDGRALTEELLATGGPFPHRLHLTERVASFYGEFIFLLTRWCEETLTEVESWPDTRDIGLTPEGRNRLEQLPTRTLHE